MSPLTFMEVIIALAESLGAGTGAVMGAGVKKKKKHVSNWINVVNRKGEDQLVLDLHSNRVPAKKTREGVFEASNENAA